MKDKKKALRLKFFSQEYKIVGCNILIHSTYCWIRKLKYRQSVKSLKATQYCF